MPMVLMTRVQNTHLSTANRSGTYRTAASAEEQYRAKIDLFAERDDTRQEYKQDRINSHSRSASGSWIYLLLSPGRLSTQGRWPADGF